MIEGLFNQFPAIKEILAGEVSKEKKKKGESVVKNEASMRFIFQKAYNLIPGGVRLFVSEKSFVDFCMKHKSIFTSSSSVPVKKTPVKKTATKKIPASKIVLKKSSPKKTAKKTAKK